MSSRTKYCERIVFLDVETNGLNKRKNDIVQFGAVVSNLKNLYSVDTVCEYFEITSPVQFQALRVHGIDNRTAKQLTKYQFFEAFAASSGFFSSAIPTLYIAHNASFDLETINNVLEANGERVIDFGVQVRTLGEAARVKGNCWMDSVTYFQDVIKISRRGSSSLPVLGSRYIQDFDKFKGVVLTLLKKNDQPIYNVDYHNAVFDSMVLYAIFLANKPLLI